MSHLILYCSFLGLSHTLPVTSYIKMLDIWMIFAMIVPFAEVAMHALNQHLKKRKISPTMSLAKKDTPFSVATLSQYLLPLVSVFYSIGFWLVGVILSLLR